MAFNYQKIAERAALIGALGTKIERWFEDCPRYDIGTAAGIGRLYQRVLFEDELTDDERIKLAEYIADETEHIPVRPGAPAPIYLWPEGKIPVLPREKWTKYHQETVEVPYMYHIPVSEGVTPKGAVLISAGGVHGMSTLCESCQVSRDFAAMGYQAFVLNNRVRGVDVIERGADTARALRIIRKNAEDYRISPDHVAFIGFSNGGLTGESNILYFSGEKKLTDYFPDYVPDELDAYYGAPDAFICVYGPRYNGSEADYTGVKYPPTFFAVGREDGAMNNLHWVYPDLVKHGVPVEVHTFAGVPHGVGGVHLLEEEIRYPNFHLWYQLADCFLEDVYKKQAQE